MKTVKILTLVITGAVVVMLSGFNGVYAQDPPPPPPEDSDVIDDSDLTIYNEDEPLDERELDALDPWFLENEPNTVDTEKEKEKKDEVDTIREQ